MRIIVTGGDGFCGWPTALNLSERGHDILIVDDLSRRRIADELAAQSLVPIFPIRERLERWHSLTGRSIRFLELDLAHETGRLMETVAAFQPDCVVHLAAQRSAPYSMSSPQAGALTLSNNILAANSMLQALSGLERKVRFVHLGSIGVYGYNEHAHLIPEDEKNFTYRVRSGNLYEVEARFPHNPTSIYHTSKAQLAVLLDFYARTNGIEIVDLYQGIVWGTQTEETSLDPVLSNRFDYDEQYGTVVNRFIVQACSDQPLSVYGKGDQTRAFIHIQDSIRCIEAAIHCELADEGKVKVMHQVAETKTISQVAALVSRHTGAEVQHIPNPRHENEEHAFHLELHGFRELNLDLRTLGTQLVDEIAGVVMAHRDRIDVRCMAPTILWRNDRRTRPSLEEAKHG